MVEATGFENAEARDLIPGLTKVIVARKPLETPPKQDRCLDRCPCATVFGEPGGPARKFRMQEDRDDKVAGL